MNNLEHVMKFACHQQPGGHVCGFYVAYHMVLAMELVKGNPEEFEVGLRPLNKDELVYIRERTTAFIVDQVIKLKGQFHLDDKTMVVMIDKKML
ncbi:hypothetical protein PVAP13_7NG135919 [Panicum virgatum]|uniref:Uncharacterized protein n=1 Tax=Panicum virgatum TaxID=38727 RepID=A0A8T0PSZ7_PANVG|nr:hypothetical protein PVAP13_7NG135919 [Panicum virgatum]